MRRAVRAATGSSWSCAATAVSSWAQGSAACC